MTRPLELVSHSKVQTLLGERGRKQDHAVRFRDFEEMSAKISRAITKMDSLESRLDEISARLDDLSARLAELE